jgi:K+-sensing histidine kinase KdpD
VQSIQEFMLWSRGFRRRSAATYAVSCLLIGMAIGVRLLFGEALPGVPYITIFPAVIVATYLGGLGPGLLATVLGGVGAWYFLLPTPYSFALAKDASPLSLVVYLCVAGFQCLLINWLIGIAEQNARLGESQRTAAQRAAASSEEPPPDRLRSFESPGGPSR